MKCFSRPLAPQIFLSFLAGLVLLMGGCATTPKIDWDARVGSFTHDQVVTEFGPPDKSAKLTDGTAVEEWLLYRHTGPSHVSYGVPFAYSGYGHSGYFVENYPGYDSFLRLTFGPDGMLKAWKKYSK